MYTEKEIVKLIGEDTAFKFELISDNIISYRSIVPEKNTGNYYTVEVFLKDCPTVFDVDSLSGLLCGVKLFRVVINNIDKTESNIEIFIKKYDEYK